jgi:hypothetical protein
MKILFDFILSQSKKRKYKEENETKQNKTKEVNTSAFMYILDLIRNAVRTSFR